MTSEIIYVVMIDDRHQDPMAHLFATEDAALAFARETARDWLVEHSPDPASEWLFYAQHPTEDDSMWVVKRTLTR